MWRLAETNAAIGMLFSGIRRSTVSQAYRWLEEPLTRIHKDSGLSTGVLDQRAVPLPGQTRIDIFHPRFFRADLWPMAGKSRGGLLSAKGCPGRIASGGERGVRA